MNKQDEKNNPQNISMIAAARLELVNTVHPKQTAKLTKAKDQDEVKRILTAVKFCNTMKSKSFKEVKQ